MCLTAACLLGPVAASARAETIVGNSLEWLTCESDVVVVGRIEQVVTTRGPGSVLYDDCTVVVEEVIKGKFDKGRVVFCLRDLSTEPRARAWMKSEQPLLLFLSRSRDPGPEKRLEGMLVPTTHEFPLSVIDLAAPGKYVIDRRFEVLSDRTVILETCRKTVRLLEEHWKKNGIAPGTKVETAYLEVPIDSKAWKSLYAGSACSLKVPAFLAPGAGKRE
jgi:hypothetical protein